MTVPNETSEQDTAIPSARGISFGGDAERPRFHFSSLNIRLTNGPQYLSYSSGLQDSRSKTGRRTHWTNVRNRKHPHTNPRTLQTQTHLRLSSTFLAPRLRCRLVARPHCRPSLLLGQNSWPQGFLSLHHLPCRKRLQLLLRLPTKSIFLTVYPIAQCRQKQFSILRQTAPSIADRLSILFGARSLWLHRLPFVRFLL